MMDITLCMGVNCTKKETCHRYMTKSDSDWQSYIAPTRPDGEPGEFDGCDMYWPEGGMKIIARKVPMTAFHYRGTKESRRRMREMEFCSDCSPDEVKCVWVKDRAHLQYYAEPGDWILVDEVVITEVLSAEIFHSIYTVEGDA